ncbi:hypothetical protein BGZ46_007870 [Entomortierella lignicola]|nr:hypothetical protein BGZ46_007870 [Entomortierella lignicola]
MALKRKVIEYYELDTSIPIAKLAHIFKIPRTTTYGIIKNRLNISGFSINHPSASRMIENRFYVLEELLERWGVDQMTLGVTLTNETYCAQGFEIHRMLSTLLKEPLPPCLFSPSWFKGFQRRRKSAIKDAQHYRRPLRVEEITRVLKYIECMDEEDIYMCDGTNMYLDLLSSSTYAHRDTDNPTRSISSAIATVLLCSNASGRDKHEPFFLGK